MPEMDGRTFLDVMRREPSLANVHVVVLSGAADASRISSDAVTKPLRLDTLLGLIERVAHVAPDEPTELEAAPVPASR
jgi:CheY-like chemotaxis protein